MAGLIKAVIFLVLIGGAIFGAKTFYFDPMKLDQEKADIKKLFKAGEHKKALAACEKLQKKDRTTKKYCDGRRYEIYKDLSDKEQKAMSKDQNAASRAGKTDPSEKERLLKSALVHSAACIEAVEKIEKYGELERVYQGYMVIAYGFRVVTMGMTEEKPKLKAAQRRQTELKE
jgi:hypothetical protein